MQLNVFLGVKLMFCISVPYLVVNGLVGAGLGAGLGLGLGTGVGLIG